MLNSKLSAEMFSKVLCNGIALIKRIGDGSAYIEPIYAYIRHNLNNCFTIDIHFLERVENYCYNPLFRSSCYYNHMDFCHHM